MSDGSSGDVRESKGWHLDDFRMAGNGHSRVNSVRRLNQALLYLFIFIFFFRSWLILYFAIIYNQYFFKSQIELK